MRSWEWGPHEGISALVRRGRESSVSLSLCELMKKRSCEQDGSCLPEEEASEWNPLCQHLDLRVPSLQHCEKQISVVSATHLWDFVVAAQTDQERGQHNLLTTSQFHCPYIHCSLIFSKGLNHCTVQGSLLRWNILPSHHLIVRATVSDWVAKLHLIIFLTTPSANSVDSGCAGSRHWVRGVRRLLRGGGCVMLER